MTILGLATTLTGSLSQLAQPAEPAGPLGPRPEPEAWWIIPGRDAGEALLTLRPEGFADGPAEAVQYRWQVLSTTPDMAVLNDPTGPWSGWRDAPQPAGRSVLSGLPTVPCAVQIRLRRGDLWTRESRFKRLGTHFLGYDDSVQTIPGCVGEWLPETVLWGTDNAAGEGRQRLPDDTRTIVAGNPDGHFEVQFEAGRVYLRPTSAGVAFWRAGDRYALTLDDAAGTVVQVEILDRTAVLASLGDDLGRGPVAEWIAYWTRLGVNPILPAQQKASGRTILLRPGFYDFTPGLGGVEGRIEGHQLLGGVNEPFVYGAADPAQRPLIAGMMFSVPNFGDTRRKVVLRDLDFLRPQAAGAGAALRVLESPEEGAAFVMERCILRSDYIEHRFGFQIRGVDSTMVGIDGLVLDAHTGVAIRDNVSLYNRYPWQIIGCSGVAERNLSTHMAGDYVNIFASPLRASDLTYRWNRHREHCGDQCNLHSDAMQSWMDGTFDGLSIHGNIWLAGYEARATGGSYSAYIANNPRIEDRGSFETAADPLLDGAYLGLTAPGTITLHDPALTPNYVFTCVNASDGVVVVRGPGIAPVRLNLVQRVQFVARNGAWVIAYDNKTMQGAPYQNDGNVIWRNSVFSHNIILGASAVSGGRIGGLTGPYPDEAPASAHLRLHNNAVIGYLFEAPRDDLTGEGEIDPRDGYFDGEIRNLYDEGIRARRAGEWAEGPVGLVDFKNITGALPDNDGARFVDAWDYLALGPGSQDSQAARSLALADANAQGWSPAIQTFADAIEAVRLRPDSPAAARTIGPVGPTDEAPGWADFTRATINPYPLPQVERTYPAAGGTLPPGESVRMWFDWAVARGPGEIILRAEDGTRIDAEISVIGRCLTVTAPLDHLIPHDLILEPGAIVHADAAEIAHAGLGAGLFSFAADPGTRHNIISTIDGTGAVMDHWLTGELRSLSGQIRLDTNRLVDPTPNLPTGVAVWSVDLAKGQPGSLTMLVRTLSGATVGQFELTANAVTGGLTPGRDALALLPIHYGITDMGESWRIWIRLDATGCGRYLVNYSTTAPVHVGRMMLVDGDYTAAPWIGPLWQG